MADGISEAEFFVAVAQAGGVGAGARALNSSPPAASRRLVSIERRLGVRLAERSARRFRLTDEGRLYLERSQALLSMRDMEAEVSSRGNIARGLLRVAAPTDLGRRRVAPALAGLPTSTQSFLSSLCSPLVARRLRKTGSTSQSAPVCQKIRA